MKMTVEEYRALTDEVLAVVQNFLNTENRYGDTGMKNMAKLVNVLKPLLRDIELEKARR